MVKQCLKEPQEALYGGGIIVNPDFNHNIEGWKPFGQGKIEERISKDGNRFLAAHSRKNASDSFSQKVQVEQGKIYTFSGNIISESYIKSSFNWDIVNVRTSLTTLEYDSYLT